MKKLIIIFFILIGWMSGYGQNTGCYQVIGPLYGKPDLYSAELLDTVCSVVDIIQNNLISRDSDKRNNVFNAYSFEFYPLSDHKNEQGNFESNVKNLFDQLGSQSDYYIVVAKIITDKIEYRVKLKLPSDGYFAGLDENSIKAIEKDLEGIGSNNYAIEKRNEKAELAMYEDLLKFLKGLKSGVDIINLESSSSTNLANKHFMTLGYQTTEGNFFVAPSGAPVYIPAGSYVTFALGALKASNTNEILIGNAEGVLFKFTSNGKKYQSCRNAINEFAGYRENCSEIETTYIPSILPCPDSNIVVFATDLQNCSGIQVGKYTYNSNTSAQGEIAGPFQSRNDITLKFKTVTIKSYSIPKGQSENLIENYTTYLAEIEPRVLPKFCLTQIEGIQLDNILRTPSNMIIKKFNDGKNYVVYKHGINLIFIGESEDPSKPYCWAYAIDRDDWFIVDVVNSEYAAILSTAIFQMGVNILQASITGTALVLSFGGGAAIGATAAEILAADVVLGTAGAFVGFVEHHDEKFLFVDLAFCYAPAIIPAVSILKNADVIKNVLNKVESYGSYATKWGGKNFNDVIFYYNSKSYSYTSYFDNVANLYPSSSTKNINDFISEMIEYAADKSKWLNNPKLFNAWEELLNFPSIRRNPIHLETYNTFKLNNNVLPKVKKEDIIEALNEFGNDADRAFYLNHLDEFNKGNRTWGHIDYEPNTFQGSIADYFRVRVANQPSELVGVAFNENGNILNFHLLIPQNLQQQKLGTVIFKRCIAQFEPSKVKGNWKTSDVYSGGESINLTVFKQKLAEGFSPQAAAFETPTGKILKDNGFGGTPTIITNTTDEVVIHFNPD